MLIKVDVVSVYFRPRERLVFIGNQFPLQTNMLAERINKYGAR